MQLQQKKLLILILILTSFSISCKKTSTTDIPQPNNKISALYGGKADEVFNAIQPTLDGGFVLAGYTYSNDTNNTVIGRPNKARPDNDIYIVKLDNKGIIQWKQRFTAFEGNDEAKAITTDNAGNIYVTGYISTTDKSTQLWLGKFDASNGNLIGSYKTFGGTNTDDARAITFTNGNLYVAGYTYSNDGDVTGNHGDFDAWVLKIDPSFNIVANKVFGGTNDDEATAIAFANGNLYIAGYTNSINGDIIGNHGGFDAWVLKLDANSLALNSSKCFGGNSINGDAAFAITLANGNLYVAGYTNSINGDVTGNHGGSDAWFFGFNF